MRHRVDKPPTTRGKVIGTSVKTSRSLTRHLPAGIVDASFASLATFAIGLTAVNLLPDKERGVYAVFFTTFIVGTVFARNLILKPAEVEAVALPLEQRVPVIRRTLTLGLGPAVVGSATSILAAAATAPLAAADVIVPLTVTTAAASVLSPLQDHVRTMLHIGKRSWLAATISVVQLVATVIAILTMMQANVADPWIPFGALAVANLVSLSFGWGLTRKSRRDPGDVLPRFADLARRGRWLVLQAAAPSIAGFAAAAIITRLASPEALGFAEAARVVAQPILVLATGLAAVLNPRVVAAAMNRDLTTSSHSKTLFLTAISITAAAYLAIAGWEWALNPMSRLVPAAYAVDGLVAVSILTSLAAASCFLQFNELMGAKRESTLTAISWSISPLLLVAGLSAGATDAFARPLGGLSQDTARYAAQARILRAHYGQPPRNQQPE